MFISLVFLKTDPLYHKIKPKLTKVVFPPPQYIRNTSKLCLVEQIHIVYPPKIPNRFYGS